ncbi:ATP-binding protein [Ferviditalea candida]|uniref:histidine kinase n=1 Tax=Ferviditalea candida TaxID=3108399 RepID=A0ABU5ZFL9_9BACL|nr:sensor histidine kinase [Paenibacillaceae bacterium T2]
MNLKKLKIQGKITLLSFGIVLFSLVMGGIILMGNMNRLHENELGQRLMITARTLAELPEVRDSLEKPDPRQRKAINDIADKLRVINEVSYLVVMDMNRIRLSHPIRQRIGQTLEGKDADPAFAEHTYLSKVKGEMGPALRAYVPIMNEKNIQVGVVMAGGVLPGIGTVIREMWGYAFIALLLLFFGVWGSWLLARHIKRQMFELEPQEIARILVERTAAFHAIQEGVVAIDKEERITILNDKARQIFGIQENVTGRRIGDVIPDTRLPEVLEKNGPLLNQELVVGNMLLLSSRIPIKVNQETVGAVAIFRDRTEAARMAEELTGVKAFVDALRVQNHEHLNKLHTIAGLLQLDQTEKALDYLLQVTEQQRELTGFLTDHIRNESLSGLLLSKVARGKELGIRVVIDKRSHLERFPERLDHHDFVIVLGNLIENAFDALQAVQDRNGKEVLVSIEQDEEILSILVEDNGCGMDEETQRRIFDKGFSTKQKDTRGIGLYLVGKVIEKGRGRFECDSKPGEGTSIVLTFPMKGGGWDGKQPHSGGPGRG